MTPHFSPDVRRVLLAMPLFTPAILSTKNGYASLILRVDKLNPYRGNYPITVRVVSWQHAGGAWVVAVAFRVVDNPNDPMEGDAYLNPRQAGDWESLQLLSRQDKFPLIFCNRQLTEAVGKAVPWTEQQRLEMQQLCAEIDKDLADKSDGVFDPDFQLAKDEFQRLYTVKDLLS